MKSLNAIPNQQFVHLDVDTNSATLSTLVLRHKNKLYTKLFTMITMLLGSIALFSSCSKESLEGSGSINTETRTVPAFTSVEVAGASETTISYGAVQAVAITGYQNLLPVYETKVTGNTLYLKFNSDIYNVKNSNIKVNIVLPLLTYMRINGSGEIMAKDFTNGDVLTALINGSGNITIENSRYDKANYSVNGSGNIMGASTPLQDAVANISGSGKIEVNVSSKLKATISGSGNIIYWGNPATMETEINGSGKVTKQ